MGLVVLVKKMSVLINFLLQNTNLVSVLSKICPIFAGHVWQDRKICPIFAGHVWQDRHISRTLGLKNGKVFYQLKLAKRLGKISGRLPLLFLALVQSEVSSHKATSSPESPSNVIPELINPCIHRNWKSLTVLLYDIKSNLN